MFGSQTYMPVGTSNVNERETEKRETEEGGSWGVWTFGLRGASDAGKASNPTNISSFYGPAYPESDRTQTLSDFGHFPHKQQPLYPLSPQAFWP